jgi:serine protease AprX
MVITMCSRPVRWTLLLSSLAVVFTLWTPAIARSQGLDGSRKLDTVLRGRSQQLGGRSRVIVEFKGDPDIRVITGRRGQAGRRMRARQAQVAELDNRSLTEVAADPRVSRIVVDRETFATVDQTGAATGAAAAREQFDVTGAGVGVAVIDSGITAWHDDLYVGRGQGAPNRVVAFKDFTADLASPQPSDPFGHGTHVAGIIAGNGYDSDGGRTGIAPGAHLVGLKVLDADGHGYISDVIEAIDYAIAVKNVYHIRVINLSVGAAVTESYASDPLTLAARRAVDAGIVVVAAAGNLGRDSGGHIQYGAITSPGNAPWVLTVGAASHQGTARRSDDVIGSFSSRGPTWIDFGAKPDLVAPGVGIESLSDPASTLYTTQAAYLLGGSRPTWYKPYLSLSGTSMAAPVVAGTVALMLQANPALTPNAVKAILQYTAENRTGESPLAQGAGLLNARGALRLARFFAAPRQGLGAPVDVIGEEPVRWSQQMIWGNYRVTGGVPLPGSNAWKTGETWGELKTTAGTPVVWGAQSTNGIVWRLPRGDARSTNASDNIVWSTASADNIVWSTAGADNIVWSTNAAENAAENASENIVWSTNAADNIVWSTSSAGNIVWSTAVVQNVVWGSDCGGTDCQRVVWGAPGADAVWGTAQDGDNIAWNTAASENIVWSTSQSDNIVWSTNQSDNIVWSTAAADQVLWPGAVIVNQRRHAGGK